MLDLTAERHPDAAVPSVHRPWRDAASWWGRLSEVTAHLSAPVAVIDVDALRHNALDMVVRSGGRPIRVASKSVRVRAVLDAVLRMPGYRGILAYTLAEALWLADEDGEYPGCDDVVVAYPTVDRGSLQQLMASERAAERITLMVDDEAQLDLIDALVPPRQRPRLRVAVDVDASLRTAALGHLGVRRSPLHTPDEAARFARRVAERDGFRLVGVQMYEAQIAGQPDDAGSDAPVIRTMQARSRVELRERRRRIVQQITAFTPLEFVTGGGTGSLESTSDEDVLTEVTAGSGLLAGHLFDTYRAFDPAPAAAFAFDVVRRPAADIATLLGGGWIASGPSVASRQPRVVWPEGLRTLPREAAGEVQTPVQGEHARGLKVGDRVWLRHAKSGEPAEHIAEYQLVSGDRLVGKVATYRGQGKVFL